MESNNDTMKELAQTMGQIEALMDEIHMRKETARVLNELSGQNGTFKIQVQLGWDFFIKSTMKVNRQYNGGFSMLEFFRFANTTNGENRTLMGEEVIVFSPIDNNTDVSLFNVAILYTKDITVKE